MDATKADIASPVAAMVARLEAVRPFSGDPASWMASPEERASAVISLQALGSPARRMLAEIVEKQIVERDKPSKTAEALYDAGFVFISGDRGLYEKSTIRSSLSGEEALDLLELLEERDAELKAEQAAERKKFKAESKRFSP